MKKYLLLLLMALLLMNCASAAIRQTGWQTIVVNDPGITLQLPTKYDVFYAGMPEDAPVFAHVDLTADDVEAILTQYGAVTIAIDPSTWNEWRLRLNDMPVKDFSLLTDLQIRAQATDMKRKLAAQGIETTAIAVYRSEINGSAWLMMRCLNPADGLESIDYYTCVNRRLYNVTLLCTSGSPDDAAQSELRLTLDRITFAD